MSSFSIPPLVGGIKFDVSSLTGGIQQITAGAHQISGIVNNDIDGAASKAEHSLKGIGHAGSEMGSEVMHGMIGAEAAMAVFPALVVEFIENPLLGTAAAAKEAIGEIIDKIKELAKEVNNLAGELHHMSLEAQKAGVSIEFFEKWVRAGKEVEVNQEQLSMGLDILNQKISEGANGNAEALKGFNQLGISQQYLQEHMGDASGVMNELADRISQLGTVSEKTDAAAAVFGGRIGRNLAPLLGMGTKAVDELSDSMKRHGAAASETDIKAAAAYEHMKLGIEDMTAGLEKKIEMPFLQYLEEHGAEWETRIEGLADALGTELPKAIEHVKPVLDSLGKMWDALADEWKKDGWLKNVVRELEVTANVLRVILDLGTAAIRGLTLLETIRTTGEKSPETAMAREKFLVSSYDATHDMKVVFETDADKAADKIVEKITPKLADAAKQNDMHLIAVAKHKKVAHAIGGRH